MRITVLGSGTSQGIPVIGCTCETCSSFDLRDKRLRSSVLVEKDGFYVVIDVGPDFRQQMLTHKVPKLDAILITHEHNDHISGLDDIRPFNFMQGGNMPLFAQKRVVNDIQKKFGYIFEKNPYPGAPRLVCHEVEQNKKYRLFPEIEVQTIGVMHGDLPILGYRIDNFAYITDASNLDSTAMGLLKNLDVLILNALQFHKHHAHFTFDEAVVTALGIGAKNTYFTHLSHTLGKHEKLRLLSPDHIQPAYDNLSITI